MRRRALGAAAALVALAAAGHLAYWYLPRERPARPDATASAWLREPGWDLVAWIPYPHQNLARLEARVGDLRAWLDLVAGGPARGGRSLPDFGPFVVPPARALAVAADASGRVRAELAAYPAIAALARAAGAVARNPWLAGGAVRWGGGGRGTVAWSGTRWRFEGREPPRPGRGSPRGLAVPPGEPAPSPLPPAFALIRLGAPLGPLPAALYRVARAGGSGRLEVIAGTPAATPPAVAGLFAATAGEGPAGWLAQAGPAGEVHAAALWDAAGDVPGLPAMATLDRGTGRGMRLPTEGLARLVGRRLAERELHGLRVRAFEPATAARAEALAAGLDAALGPEAGGYAALAAARPAALAARARTAAEALEAVPLVGASEAEPLRRLERLLAPLAGCPEATLEVAAGGTAVRFVPCG